VRPEFTLKKVTILVYLIMTFWGVIIDTFDPSDANYEV
jgi:hypothetical protein